MGAGHQNFLVSGEENTMIKDRTPAEIRQWVGRTTYDMVYADAHPEQLPLHRFLKWVNRNTEIPNAPAGIRNGDYAYAKIGAGSDEDVLQWYLQWIMAGAGEKYE